MGADDGDGEDDDDGRFALWWLSEAFGRRTHPLRR